MTIMKHLFVIFFTVLVSVATLLAQETDSIPQQQNSSVLQKVERWYEHNMNYWSITALMTLESSFIPFPSEIVIPPAVYVAENPKSNLNVTDSYVLNVLLIIVFGTIGAIFGAIINYLLSMWLGRPIIYKFADSKFGHLCLLSSDKVKRAENYFNNHGKVSTFVGRLIPGIRQLISIPAGLSKMNFWSFIAYTALGAGIWNAVLALLGYVAHGQADLIDKYNHELSIAILALVAVVIVWWIVKKIIARQCKG
ncbi:MAG: DedA family protein [Sphingobacteriia bacterium]|nr:DedA family protein [Sphingobacteriia bacterium]